MDSVFLALLPYSNDKILTYFNFGDKEASTDVNIDNSSTNFDGVQYLSTVLNISDEQARNMLNGDLSLITYPPSYELAETYIARYKNGTLLSGIGKDNIIITTLNKLIEDKKISIDDISNVLSIKYNPEFTESISHISARVKRKLKHKEITIAVCTISINADIHYEYYIPKSFNGTVLEYNKRLEDDPKNLYLRPLESGWIILGLDTTKNYDKGVSREGLVKMASCY